MTYFEENMTGVSSKWFVDQEISHCHIWDDMTQDFVRQFLYHIDIIPDRNTLSNMRKKPNKCFREYVMKWKEQAFWVKQSFTEQELVDIFIDAQDPNYFHLLGSSNGKTVSHNNQNWINCRKWCQNRKACEQENNQSHNTGHSRWFRKFWKL